MSPDKAGFGFILLKIDANPFRVINGMDID
jgi:hypothetical protein